MMFSSNAYSSAYSSSGFSAFRKSGGRHRAGKRVQAKRALFMMRQQSVARDAFPPLSEPYDHDAETVSEIELIKAIEDMVDDVGGSVIWQADVMFKKLM
jgi:hypothetical protein